MLKRLIAMAVVAVAALFAVGTVPASAQVYPPSGGGITTSTSSPVAGQPFTLTIDAGSFDPGSPVTITVTKLSSSVGQSVRAVRAQTTSGTADSKGGYSEEVTINEPGTYRITASGTLNDEPVSYSKTVTVTGGGSNGGGSNSNGSSSLASTGAGDVLKIAGVGAALLAAGVMVVFATRRREERINH